MPLPENNLQGVHASIGPGKKREQLERKIELACQELNKSLNVSIEKDAYEEEDDNDQYDYLLDDLLSDEAESPEALRENIENSPTFQRFWNSADSDEEEEDPMDEQRGGCQHLEEEQRDDRSISFYSDHQQNENESKIMSPTKASIQSPLNKSFKSNPRNPLSDINHQNVAVNSDSEDDEFAYDTGLPLKYNKRRVSTGSLPVQKPTMEYDPELWKARELPANNGDSSPMVLDLNDILPAKSAEEEESVTVAITASMSSEAATFPEIRALKSSSTEPSGNERVEQEGTDACEKEESTDEENQVDAIDNNESDTSRQRTLPEVDPYEWAYNVWKRKGLMAGTPTAGPLPQSPATDRNSNHSSTSLPQNPSFESTNSGKTSASFEHKRLRNPKDRLSLPAKIAAFETKLVIKPQQKARNGVGFSMLLNKWKEKSDDNPNAHFLSPREHVAEKARQINNKVAEASIDNSSLLSPSKRRQSLDPKVLAKAQFQPKKHQPIQQQQQNVAPKPVATESPTQNKKHPQHKKTPSKDKNALSRYLQPTKSVQQRMSSRRSLGAESRDNQSLSHITKVIDENKEMDTKEYTTPVKQRPATMASLLYCDTGGSRRSVCSRRSISSRRSLSPSSSMRPLFSLADDTLLEPREVMGHRRQSTSDRSSISKATPSNNDRATDASHSVPCKEIFIIRDGSESDNLVSCDDSKSVLSESVCQHSLQSSQAASHAPSKDPSQTKKKNKAPKTQITNLQDIMELKVDSMSFDSQSHNTHITFRTETLKTLDNKVSAITSPPRAFDMDVSQDLSNLETPSRDNLIGEMGDMTGATPEYSERPWRKDLLVRNVTTAMEKARAFDCDCKYSLAAFNENDEMVDFFLPLMAVTCSCRKSKQLMKPDDPTSLENILRPWQISFLKAFGITKGDQLVKAHHRSAR